jgi:hypothetical protein
MQKAYKSPKSKLRRVVEENKITTYLEERDWEGAVWLYVARDKFRRWFFVSTHNATTYAIKGWKFVDQLCDY